MEAITAAVEVAAQAEQERHLTLTTTLHKPALQKPTLPEHTAPRHTRSTLSDSTVADNEASESDSSAQPHSPESTSPVQNKRRASHTLPSCPQSSRKRVNPSSDHDSFPAEMLLDLAGSTSAEVRRMNDDQRALVHYKRRLRNRESAKRSRARRQATLQEIQTELEDLRQLTANLLERCMSFARTSEKQNQELETVRKEKQLLESMLRSGGHASAV